MKKKQSRIIYKVAPVFLLLIFVLLWEVLSQMEVIPRFLLPSPLDILKAFISDFSLLMEHTGTTLLEAFSGLFIAVVVSFVVSFLMDRFLFLHRCVYPVLVITQTIPTVAIAPLLVLWMGYGILPKITLVAVCCFFPITVGLLDGFQAADQDSIDLLRTMGASKRQVFLYSKLPFAMSNFFAGLRIAVSYSVVGAVIAEWLGGYSGLGVYMTKVKKSYAFDKMFAVIFLISIVSLLLMKGVTLLQRAVTPWDKRAKKAK